VPSIAALIPYHDEGALLTRCLDSIARQTRPVDEILVYDDASSVRPEPFVPDGLEVRVLRGESNIGPARARNVLARESRSDLLHFHDADDAFERTWCERVHAVMQDGAVDVFLSDVAFVFPDGRRVEGVVGLDRLAAGDDLASFCIRGAMLAPAGTYRRAAFQRIGGYRETLWQSEDWDFHIRLALSGARTRLTTDSLVVAHRRPTSRSEHGREVSESTLKAVALLSAEVPDRYRADLSDVAARMASRLFRLGARTEARRGFQLAFRLGRPSFDNESRAFRLVADIAGPYSAEWAGSLYRTVLPPAWRAWGLRKLGFPAQ
jgi:glycosyltransferase involved in cell wall biosynthesis